jgi:hypothetical protein
MERGEHAGAAGAEDQNITGEFINGEHVKRPYSSKCSGS